MKSVDNLPVFGLKNLVSGFVISVKILRLKLVRYIADIHGYTNKKAGPFLTLPY
jgi:hypothetical protein